MTIQELVDWCTANGIGLDTEIALRAKDDYFVTYASLSLDKPYFGNSPEGGEWIRMNVTLDEDGYPDFDKLPNFLILDTGRG